MADLDPTIIHTINTGLAANDGTGDSIRAAFQKVNASMLAIAGENGIVDTAVATAVQGINAEFDGGTISNATTIADGTQSSNYSTGALVVAGGIGIGGVANFADIINCQSLTTESLAAVESLSVTNNSALSTVSATNISADNISLTNTLTASSIEAGTATFSGLSVASIEVTGTATLAGLSLSNISADNIALSNELTATNIEATGTATLAGIQALSSSLGAAEAVSLNVDGAIAVATGNVNVATGHVNITNGHLYSNSVYAVNGNVITGQVVCNNFVAGDPGGNPNPGFTNRITMYAEDDSFIISTQTPPVNSTDPGEAGEIRLGEDTGTTYLYYCIAPNTWVRTAFATW